MLKNKIKVFWCVLLLAIFLTSVVSALTPDLEVEKKSINDVVISEVDHPAVFSFKIKNNGAPDRFKIYSLVGVDIKPDDEFFLDNGEEKEIIIEATPGKALKQDTGSLVFIYKIKGKSSGIYEDTLRVNIVKVKDAFKIGAYAIDPESEFSTVYFKNVFNTPYENIKARFSSVFFDFEKEFSLEPLEKKEFDINLNKKDIAALTAGQYLLRTDIEIGDFKGALEGTIRFSERQFIDTETEKFGIAITKKVIRKTNQGNLPTIVDVAIKKNIISKFFTSFNVEPYKSEWDGLSVYYYWQKELKPSESFIVKITTNWLYPILVIIAVVVIFVLFRVYKRTHIILRKKVNFVRTKGGEFALKVSLIVRAKSFVERVSIFDKIPSIAKLYERYGAIAPDRYDKKNNRLEWTINNLSSGEERILSYIIYSKVSLVGRFELPRATAVYEKNNKIIETESNRAFIVTEPKTSE